MDRGQLVAAAEREAAMRERLYPKWVAAGRMTEAQAAYEMTAMRLIARELAELNKSRRALGINQSIPKADLDFVRSLGDFDLTMLLSEIHDHGWPSARDLIPAIRQSIAEAGPERPKA
jgi:hypothetical protein